MSLIVSVTLTPHPMHLYVRRVGSEAPWGTVLNTIIRLRQCGQLRALTFLPTILISGEPFAPSASFCAIVGRFCQGGCQQQPRRTLCCLDCLPTDGSSCRLLNGDFGRVTVLLAALRRERILLLCLGALRRQCKAILGWQGVYWPEASITLVILPGEIARPFLPLNQCVRQ